MNTTLLTKSVTKIRGLQEDLATSILRNSYGRGVELGEPIGLDQRCISILARLKTDLPKHMQVIQSQVRGQHDI